MDKAIAKFRTDVKKAVKTCGLDMVLNMDETPCRLVEVAGSGWANEGDTQLELLVDVSDKIKITMMPTITA